MDTDIDGKSIKTCMRITIKFTTSGEKKKCNEIVERLPTVLLHFLKLGGGEMDVQHIILYTFCVPG